MRGIWEQGGRKGACKDLNEDGVGDGDQERETDLLRARSAAELGRGGGFGEDGSVRDGEWEMELSGREEER